MQVLAHPQNALYCDGGCNNNTDRKGAYSFVCVELGGFPLTSSHKHGTLLFGKSKIYQDTTNNIMEMQAVLEGVIYCDVKGVDVAYIVTDSEYVTKGITEWSVKWRQNGWKSCVGKPIVNKELWVKLLARIHPLTKIVHVKGHSGVYWNEVCDKNASQLMKEHV